MTGYGNVADITVMYLCGVHFVLYFVYVFHYIVKLIRSSFCCDSNKSQIFSKKFGQH